MATFEELSDALKNADAAGDHGAARQLADAIVQMRAPQAPPADTTVGDPMGGGIGGNAAGFGTTATYGQMAKAAAVGAGSAIPFADRAAAGINTLPLVGNGKSYDENLAAQQALKQEAQQNNAGPYLAGQAATSLGYLGGLAKGGVTLAGRMGEGLLPRILGYGAEGAGYGALQGAADTHTGNLKDYADNAMSGAQTGALVGAGLPAVGSAAGALYRGSRYLTGSGVDGVGRVAGALLNRSAVADESGLRGLSANPDAMLVDAGPSMRGLGQGAATGTGTGKSSIVNALTERDAGTNDRLGTALDANFGPFKDPQIATQEMRAARKTADNQAFGQIWQNPTPPVDTSNVIATIGQGLNKAADGGMEQKALNKMRTMLMTTDASGNAVPVADAEKLHNVKVEIGNLIKFGDAGLGIAPGAVGKQQGAFKTAYGNLREALGDQVPGYDAATKASQQAAKDIGAVETGVDAFDRGKSNATSPDLFAQRLSQMQPSEADALRTGMRGEAGRIVGTNVHDLPALERTLMTPNDWNHQKAGQAFGDTARDNVADALKTNRTMRDSYQQIVQGSRTAPSQAAAAEMEPSTYHFPMHATFTGLAGRGIQMVARALSGASSESVKDQIGQVLATRGPEVQKIVQTLLDHASTTKEGAAALRNLLANPALVGASASEASRR